MAAELVTESQDQAETVCKRCHTAEATQLIRSEQVCENCFVQYVTTKGIKRMETYKTRGSATKIKKLLLPISFGPSSISLLHILDRHIQIQHDRMGRASYELVVVHVFVEFDDPAACDRSLVAFEKIKRRFPRHVCFTASLEEALNLDSLDWNVWGLDKPMDISLLSAKETLSLLLKSASEATSRADIVSTLLTRLFVEIAVGNSCESILFGDSTTRLAEKTLTETAKGRGFSLPWQISDGMSPYGVNFHYPLRDVLKKEVVTFSYLTTPPLNDLIVYQSQLSHLSASSKSTTIDQLMEKYFESVEENYPSIVANVVRTSSKLKASAPDYQNRPCGLCGLPVAAGTDGITGWSGDQNSEAQVKKPDITNYYILCYGCSRSIHG